MISPKRIAVVQVARQQLKLDEAQYRGVLRELGNVESAKDLDEAGFEQVMLRFNALGFRSTWTKRTYGNRPKMATPSQIDLIRHLWREWSGADDEKALNTWLEASFKVTTLRFVAPGVAHAAITALKAMKGRQVRGEQHDRKSA